MSETKSADAQPKIDPEKTHLVAQHKLSRPLTACFWEPQNRFILVGLQDNGIVRFDLESQEAVAMKGPHDSWVRAIGTSPDGQITYSAGYDGRLIWWPTDAATPEPIHVVDAHQGWIRALAVSPDGRRVATCGNDRQVRLWDTETAEQVSEWAGHQSHVYNVVFSSAGDRLFSCDHKGFVKIWQLESVESAAGQAGKEKGDANEDQATAEEKPVDLVRVENLHKYDTTFRADIGGARCMTLSQDGSRLAIGGITNVTNAFAGVGDALVAVVDIVSGEMVIEYAPKKKVRGTAWGVAHHPEGFWIGLAGGGGGGWFYFWRGEKSEEFFKLKLKNDGRGMSLSPDASQVAVAHADQFLRLYALYADS